jgi:hypothetical protein
MPLVATQTDTICTLAAEIRERFGACTIDDVALAQNIILIRTDGPHGKDAGFARLHFIQRPAYLESLARPGEFVRLWQYACRIPIRSIAINRNASIPEPEIFWHEYYHLYYSPSGIQQSERILHHYSTEGALHFREERRANEFAAAVLVPPEAFTECETIHELMERYTVSERIANIAAGLYNRKQ